MKAKLVIYFILLSVCGCIEDNISPWSPESYQDYITGSFDQFPKFSPDGKTVAYCRFSAMNPEPTEGSSGIYTIDITNGEKQQLLKGIFYDVTWSPDGNWLLFINSGKLYKYHISKDSLAEFQIEGTVYHPDWSSLNDQIVFVRPFNNPEPHMFTINSSQADEKLLYKTIIYGHYPEFHPFKQQVIYLDYYNDLSVIDSSGNIKRITMTDEDKRDPSWHPTGEKITYSSNGKILIHDLSNNLISFIHYGYYPDISLDGKLVFSFADPDRINEVLYMSELDGSEIIQLTP